MANPRATDTARGACELEPPDDLWCVAIGSPPWHFGPFPSEAAAREWALEYGGDTWPLWHPVRTAPRVQAGFDDNG